MNQGTLNTADLLKDRRTIVLGGTRTDDWRRINEASLNEYRDHHQGGNYPPASLAIMNMFEGFIAKWALTWGASSMLDLGCGIGTTLPPYVRNLADNLAYVGLDPLQENHAREYPFLSGRLEDLAEHTLTEKFGMAVFATSLDHFEDIDAALKLVPSVVEDGRIVIWCGIHDSHLAATNYASARILEICSQRSSMPSRIIFFLAYAFLTWPRVVVTLARRERALKANRPLDNLHFHYFTEASLRALLSKVGTVHEFALCPGTNSAFVSLTVGTFGDPASPHPDEQ